MNFRQKQISLWEKEIHAGGLVHVPPTACLLPACASAYTPARVERTGRAETNKYIGMGRVGRFVGIGLFLRMGPTA